jgi:hypothetical protein
VLLVVLGFIDRIGSNRSAPFFLLAKRSEGEDTFDESGHFY